MKVITNEFLLCLANDKEQMQGLIAQGKESKELEEIDYERKLEAGKAYFKTMESEAFKKIMNDVNEEDRELLKKIALTIHSVREYQSIRTKLLDQIKLCEELLKSDLCKRNTDLYFCTFIERLKLKSIDYGKLMPRALKALDLLLERAYPEMSDRKRYIELSNLMNSLEIYTLKNKPFLTIEMAQKLDTKSKPEEIVIDKIKKILKQFD